METKGFAKIWKTALAPFPPSNYAPWVVVTEDAGMPGFIFIILTNCWNHACVCQHGTTNVAVALPWKSFAKIFPIILKM